MTSPDHAREDSSLLAVAEKRLLIRIARRLPSWVTSDQLTLLGLVSMPAAGLAFAAAPYSRSAPFAVVAALALNWFGDSLDGTLARVRCQPRPRYGYYVDHVTDLTGTVSIVAGLAASGWMQPWIAAAVASAYFLVAAETFLATHAAGIFRLSFAGVGPTELRILIAFGAFYVQSHPWVDVVGLGRQMRLLDVSGLVATAALVVVFAASAIRTTRALYRAEPLPRRRDTECAA